MARPFRRAKLPQSFSLDLADALTSDSELLTDFFQRMLALAADAEAQTNHLLFLRREGLQDIGRLIADVGVDYGIYRRSHPAVFDQIAQGGLAVAAHRRLQRNRVARNGLQLLDLLYRNVHATA